MATEDRYNTAGTTYQPTSTVDLTSQSTSGAQSTTTSESSQVLNNQFVQNMPQFGLDALQQLIAQLMGGTVAAPQAQSPGMQAASVRTGGTVGIPSPFVLQQPSAFNFSRPPVTPVATAPSAASGSVSGSVAATIPGVAAANKLVAERQLEIERNRALQGEYSKAAAMVDAQNLTAYFQRKMMEEAMPSITRGAEGAGTSQSTVRALLAQKAATQTAENAAAAGTQLAVSYGGINTQLAGVLEALTRSDPNSPLAMLLNAIGLTKGATQSTSGSQSSSGTKTVDTTTSETKQGMDMKVLDYTKPGGGDSEYIVKDVPIQASQPTQDTSPSYGYIVRTTDSQDNADPYRTATVFGNDRYLINAGTY